jgi:FAD synthetase
MRVMMFGTFDVLHQGHRFILEKGEKRGELTVVVARDTSVLTIKGRAAEHDEVQRVAAVKSVVPHATVILGDSSDFLTPVRLTKPDLILLGYDQTLPPGVEEEDLPCPVERLPAFEPETYKSSKLRKQS